MKKYFNPLINQFTKFYNADEYRTIEFYGNCYNGNAGCTLQCHTVNTDKI